MKEISLFFIASLFLISCNNTTKIEERITNYGDCVIKAYYIDNILNGPYIQYTLGGKIISMLNFVNGKAEGKELAYYPNGNLMQINSYLNDKLNGYSYSFNENGLIRLKELFLNGVKVGHTYYFTSKGKPFKYNFTGYSNLYLFRQIIDSITGEQKIYGDILVDSLVLVDSINNKTKLMIAQPFGLKPHVEMRQLYENNDYNIWLFKVNENGEHVFSNHISHLKGLRPIVGINYINGAEKINDYLYVKQENCIEVTNYIPKPLHP